MCSMVTLLSCLIVSLSLLSRDPASDLHHWNRTEIDMLVRSKSSIAHFRYRSSAMFIIDLLCLVWGIGETVLRTLSTPSLVEYFTSIGFIDITG
jgi:hypothetical protein